MSLDFFKWRGTRVEPPRISVVIPLYNHEQYVEQAIASVLAQTRPVDEVIIVDDGSRDSSARLAQEYARRHANIIFWSHRNRGAHATIHAGLQRADGDLVAILNSDDLFHQDRIAEVVRVFEKNAGTDAVATSLAFIDGAGAAIPNPWYEEARRYYDQVGDMGLALLNGNFLMTTSNLVMRRRLLDEIGGFSALRYAHDLDYFLRLLVKGKTLRLLEKPLVSYRIHGTNTISEDHLKVKVEWAAVTAFYLTCLWDRRDLGPIDWHLARRVLDVLDRHGLQKPVQLLMVYFREHPTDTLEASPFHEDAAFRSLLTEVVR
jgi:glycosyltransferase involved in cell wall biosynthesis